MAKAKVKVVHQTDTGLNDRVSINGVTYTNTQAYNKAMRGEVPGYHGVKSGNTKYIRSNPDDSKNNNLDR